MANIVDISPNNYVNSCASSENELKQQRRKS